MIYFQTIPDTKVTSLDEHFNKCNNIFKRNIGRLCDQNKKSGFFGWTNNQSCHGMKQLFHAGVQWTDALRFNKGRSYIQGQKDQFAYLKRLYGKLEYTYCQENDSLKCSEIKNKLEALNQVTKKNRGKK